MKLEFNATQTFNTSTKLQRASYKGYPLQKEDTTPTLQIVSSFHFECGFPTDHQYIGRSEGRRGGEEASRGGEEASRGGEEAGRGK
jgi:hypothetical protein